MSEDRPVLSAKDLLLLLTMPVWLPVILLGGLAVTLLAGPILLFGPVYAVGVMIRDGYGPGIVIAVGIVGGAALLKMALWGRRRSRARPSTALCPRCGNLEPNNAKVGPFTCTVCGLT